MTLDPIRHSIKENKPDFIFLFCSKGSAQNLSKLTKSLKISQYDYFVTSDHENPQTCYSSVKHELDNILKKADGDDVIVDITGGTKAMSAALMTATAGMGFKYCYVGGVSRDKHGRVKKKSEKLYWVDDPTNAFHEREKALFINLFNNYLYESARRCIDDLKLTEQETELYEGLRRACAGYHRWDHFDHERALEELRESNKLLRNYLRYCPNKTLNKLLEEIRESIQILSRIVVNKSGKPGKRCFLIASDLYANAIRRYKQGKYDDAVARLYSCLELCGKIELASKGIDDSDVDLSKLPDCRIKRELPNRDRRIELGLYKKYELLHELGTPLGGKYALKKDELKKVLEARNSSILAHGTRPIEKSQTERLIEIVREFVTPENISLPSLTAW